MGKVMLLFVVCLFFVLDSYAGELIGSQAVIENIRKAAASAASMDVPGQAEGPRKQLGDDVKSFSDASLFMKPAAAARGWLELVDRYTLLPGANGESGDGLQFRTIMEVMPGPSSWSELTRMVRARKTDGEARRRNTGLKILSYYLNNQPDQELKLAEEYEKELHGAMAYDGGLTPLNSIISLLRSRRSLEGRGIPESFEEALRTLQGGRPGDRRLVIPDLVAVAGKEKAEILIRKALQIPGIRVSVPEGKETMDLTRALVLENLSALQSPQWNLVDSITAVELFEALSERFSAKKDTPVGSVFVQGFTSGSDTDYDERMAQSYYIMGLLAEGKMSKAVAYFKGLRPTDAAYFRFNDIANGEDTVDLTQPLFEFYRQVLKGTASVRLWDQFMSWAVSIGQAETAVKLLEDNFNKASLSPADQFVEKELRLQAYLALDDVDKAVSIIKEGLAIDITMETALVQGDVYRKKYQMGMAMLTLGRLLNKSGWVNDGLAVLKTSVASTPAEGRQSPWELDEETIGFLVRSGFAQDTEALIMASMLKKVQAWKKSQQEDGGVAFDGVMDGEVLSLLWLYTKEGRSGDVIFFLEHWPWFNVSDVKYANSRDIGYITAKALHELGRDADAGPMLKELLMLFPGDDDLYQLLISSSQGNLISWLDRLYERNRLEERPLIWKAVLLLKEKKLDEAEAVIRTALKIDPSDGEKHTKDRMRGYGVLADILDAKGDKDNAAFFHRAVDAIRLAYVGDEFTNAGLLRRSIRIYEDAQHAFSDAYCIQWRLGERYYSVGDYKQAEAHYRLAFERMPEQFGKMANLCFGCEGVFKRRAMRTIAETVLAHAAKMGNVRPQVYLLWGELREAQGKSREAYGYYRKALALDPEYWDALLKILHLRDKLFLNSKEEEKIAFEILRLDPLMQNGGIDLSRILDVKRLWGLLEGNRKVMAPSAQHWFILKATQENLEKSKNALAREREWYVAQRDKDGWGAPQYLLQSLHFNSIAELISGEAVSGGYY